MITKEVLYNIQMSVEFEVRSKRLEIRFLYNINIRTSNTKHLIIKMFLQYSVKEDSHYNLQKN